MSILYLSKTFIFICITERWTDQWGVFSYSMWGRRESFHSDVTRHTVSVSSWPVYREDYKRLGIPEERGTNVVETAINAKVIDKVLRCISGFQFRPPSFPDGEGTSSKPEETQQFQLCRVVVLVRAKRDLKPVRNVLPSLAPLAASDLCLPPLHKCVCPCYKVSVGSQNTPAGRCVTDTGLVLPSWNWH